MADPAAPTHADVPASNASSREDLTGTRVEPGDVIGLLQVAQLCLPVVAPAAGVVSQCLVAPGTKVGYATPLFEISPTA